jgi:hypothetical protein
MRTLLIIISVAFAFSCTKKSFKRGGGGRPVHSPTADANSAAQEDSEPGAETMQNAALVWKRYRAFEQGLLGGLELSKAELCQEAGQYSCIDKVHLTALGGNAPYENGQYERMENPSVLTPVAVDRVLLSACTKRVDLDRAAGQQAAVVFKHFPLTNAAVNAEQAKPLVVDLYRRLLARDPNAEEIKTATAFTKTMSEGGKLAAALCYAIGSTAENVFL